MVSLEELDLSKNRLTELKRSALHRLPRLRTVDLSHNQIRSFHSDAFKDTPQVCRWQLLAIKHLSLQAAI